MAMRASSIARSVAAARSFGSRSAAQTNRVCQPFAGAVVMGVGARHDRPAGEGWRQFGHAMAVILPVDEPSLSDTVMASMRSATC